MMKYYFDRSYFFDQGIRFLCQQCGACCTGVPGAIYVSKKEIKEIAYFLELPVSVLFSDYIYLFQNRLNIKEDTRGRCIFYHPSKGCTIYSVRPNQCRYFPFWWKNLRNEYNWQQTKLECPGIGTGPIYTKEDILNLLQDSIL